MPARSRSSREYFTRLDHMCPQFEHASHRGTTGSRCSISAWWQRGHSGSGAGANLRDKPGSSKRNFIGAYQEAYQQGMPMPAPPAEIQRRTINHERSSIKHDRSSISSTCFAQSIRGGGRCRRAREKGRACDAGDDHDQAYWSRARHVAGLAAGRTNVQPQGRRGASADFERVCN